MREGRQIAEPEGMTKVYCFLYNPCLERYFVKKQEIKRQEPAVEREVISLAMQVDTAESARSCPKIL